MNNDKDLIKANKRLDDLNNSEYELVKHEEFELSLLEQYCKGKAIEERDEILVSALLDSKRSDRKHSIYNVHRAVEFYISHNMGDQISLDNIAKHIKSQYTEHPRPGTKQSIIQIDGLSKYVALSKLHKINSKYEKNKSSDVQSLSALSPETLAEELLQLRYQIKGLKNNEARLRSIINKGLSIYSSGENTEDNKILPSNKGLSEKDKKTVLDKFFSVLSDDYGFVFKEKNTTVEMIDSDGNTAASDKVLNVILSGLGISKDDLMVYVE